MTARLDPEALKLAVAGPATYDECVLLLEAARVRGLGFTEAKFALDWCFATMSPPSAYPWPNGGRR